MANDDLKDVEALQHARNTPHCLDVISESRPINSCDTVVEKKDIQSTDLALPMPQ